MGRIVIVAYRPKPGKENELEALSKTHMQILQSETLITDREPIVMRSEDGSMVEVFEWRSKQAIEEAHSNESVQELWQRYTEVCDYIPISTIEEATEIFSEFTPVN